MSGGRQLSGVARSCLKLHNLILASHRSSTASSPAVDRLDDFAARLVQEKSQKWRANTSVRHRDRERSSAPSIYLQHDHDVETKLQTPVINVDANYVPQLPSTRSVDELVLIALSKNKHSDVDKLLSECENHNTISGDVLLKLFIKYSDTGQTDRVLFLQDYSLRLHPKLFTSNGSFSHYLAKAHCLRGNAEKGLSILSEAYEKNKSLRNTYRGVLRELVQDSVSNRSEATLVVFRKRVEGWSERWHDHYPLVCFWHSCWASTWFSDQRLADELMDMHEPLREIIKDRASALSRTALYFFKDDDAVVRLLQALLRHGSVQHYVKVLQILFHYRLKNRDMRGCSEILQNCKNLGVTLSSSLQGKYINMVIDGEHTVKTLDPAPRAPSVKDFKLKF